MAQEEMPSLSNILESLDLNSSEVLLSMIDASQSFKLINC